MSAGAAADRPPWAPRTPILVIGDFCVDVYLRATASRLSRESPLHVFSLEPKRVDPVARADGGAGNVARQLEAYGVDVCVVPLAHQAKVRVLAGAPAREVFRLDGPWERARPGGINRLLGALAGRYYAAAVYVDYRGQPGPPANVRRFLETLGCPLIGDARSNVYGWRGFAVLKMNAVDAGLAGAEPSPAELYAALGKAATGGLVLTRGAQGHIALGRDWIVRQPAVEIPGPVLNVSGSGDVFTATLAAVLAGDHEIGRSLGLEHAADLAGRAAGLRVRKQGYNEAVAAEEVAGWQTTS